MRVLLTTDTIGGVWTYTRELTEGLLERLHSVALVSLGRLPSEDQFAWCSAIASRYGDDFHYIASDVPLEWMEENGRAYRDAEDLLLDLAHEFEADLIHSSQYCFGQLPTSIPRLVAAHSDVLSWAAACQLSGLAPSPWLDRYKRLVSAGLRSATAVVAPSHWMMQELADYFPLPAEARVILNGRDLPPAQTHPSRKLQGITAGRLWDPAKGLSTLADVNTPFPLFVAGETRHESEFAPAQLGPAQPLGRLQEETLLEWFRSSSVYLALSIYEPFGLAPLEAALCGCAILARDIPPLREIWGEAALYFQDADGLSALLANLASHSELLADFQARALRCAREMSRSSMTEMYLDFYRDLIELTQSASLTPAALEAS